MDKHGELETIVQVSKLGSFSAASRALGMTPSAVSRIVKRLEQRLGVRLFERTTRQLRLTPEGQALNDRATRILEDIREAERAVAGMKGALKGRIVVDSSVPLANHRLIPLLPAFARRYPGLHVDMTLSDDLVDVIAGGADVVLRVKQRRVS